MAERVVYLDTNVVLDHLMDRQPFAEYSHRLFALAETGKLKLYVSALTFCHLYYLLTKASGHHQALELLRQLRQLVHVSGLGEREIDAALAAPGRDFEDQVQYASAQTIGPVEAILTRNRQDFPAVGLPVCAPDEFLARFESAG
ncbi:MAG: PIN domain-containing protein [Opitutaceae bacterium]|nr:PIN domain-containing protein [Opitutaceae bacterium]